MGIAISYARYSSEPQQEGESLRRQEDAARAYALAQGLPLDKDLSFRDLGVSGWDKSNIQRGALGLFLQAIQQGKIPADTTLIIESFDRLSRAEPLDAFNVFSSIIGAGITLVTLTEPPKVFSRESVRANMFQLFEALLDMHRAHAESQRKSQLISSAWVGKKARAAHGEIMSAKGPNWIDITVDHNLPRNDPKRRTAALNPERSQVVLDIMAEAASGVGNHTLVRTLNAKGVEPWSWKITRRGKAKPAQKVKGAWEPSYMQKLLTNPALYGAIKLDGEIFRDYYPPLITEDEYHVLQFKRSDRSTTKGRTHVSRKGKNVTNLFSGRLYCGYCGSTMSVGGYKSSKERGYDRKYYGCYGARIGATPCKMKMWFIDELELPVLFWLTTVDYAKISGSKSTSAADVEIATLARLRHEDDELARKAKNVEASIMDEGATGLGALHNSLIDQRKLLAPIIQKQKQKVALSQHSHDSDKQRITSMMLLFKRLNKATDEVELRSTREKLSDAISVTVERVTLFPAGSTVSGAKDERFIDVVFSSGAKQRIGPNELVKQWRMLKSHWPRFFGR